MNKINDGSRTLIFCETKKGVDNLNRSLRYDKWHGVRSIHGDKCQSERENLIKEFKEGICNILIATDVASRGLDVKDIKYVINYDMPHQIEDYVHRIGRTGRAGTEGSAYSFFTAAKNGGMAADLVNMIKQAGQEVDPDLQEMAGRRSHGQSKFRRWGSFPRQGSN